MTESTANKLPPIAQAAWEAYQRMSETKNTYYGFLQSLEKKYDKGQTPSDEENQELEIMLKAHGETVAEFNEAMRAVIDPGDRMLLLDKMS